MISNLKIVRQKLELKSRLEVISQIQSRVHELSSLEDEYSKFSCKIAMAILQNLNYVKNENDLLNLIERLNNFALNQEDPEKTSIVTQITSALLQIKI
jgi:hypothetical protein